MMALTTQYRCLPVGVLPGRRAPRWLLLVLPVWLCLAPCRLQAQSAPETVGRIEGEDIAVKGPMSVETENGRSTTVLSSGSDVTVRSGEARLVIANGEIGICAPAHFWLLKSGGAITLALDYGRVRVRLDGNVPLTIFTPLIVATPMAIADGPRDSTVGLWSTGAMCVLAARGAVRVEQQLTGQSLLVPQSGEIALAGGQMDSLRGAPGTCSCEVFAAESYLASRRSTESKPADSTLPVSASLARLSKPPEEPVKKENPGGDADPKPPAIEEPIYKVLMPPLSFDAAAPAPPPEPSPETILLVREARVRPAVIFRGRVVPAPEPPQPATLPAPISRAAEDSPARKSVGFFARLGNFFRRLVGRGPCAGAGCGGVR